MSEDVAGDGPTGEATPRRRWPEIRQRVGDAWLVPMFAALSVLMTFPRPWRITTEIPGDGGDALFIVWTMRWVNHAILHGWSDLWSAPIFWPTKGTLAYSDTLLPMAPIFGLLEWATGSTALAFNVLYLSAWTLGLWFTYRLAFRLLGSRAPAVLCAIAFTFATPHLTQYRHLQLVIGGLLPGVLLLVLRFFERPGVRRGAVLAAAIAALTMVASYYGLAVIVGAATIAVVMLARRGVPWRRIAVGGAVAAAVGAVLLLPLAFRYSDITSDPALRRQPDPAFAAAPSDLLAVSVDNRFVGDMWPVADRFLRKTSENWLFPGYVASVLAVVGVAGLAAGGRLRRRRETLAVLAAAAVCAVLAFGDFAMVRGRHVELPFSVLRAHLPGFSGIRVPARFMLVGTLGIAILAGAGFGVVRRRLSPRIGLVVLAGLIGLVLVETATRIETVEVEPSRAAAAVNRELVTRPDGAVVELPIRSSVDGPAWSFVEVSRQLTATIDWHPRVNGQSGYEPPGYPELAARINTFPSADAMRLLVRRNVRYVVIRTALPIDLGRVRDAAYGAHGVGVVSTRTARDLISRIPPGRFVSATRYGSAYLVELRLGSFGDRPARDRAHTVRPMVPS